MMFNTWQILARSSDSIPEDWREQMVMMLGHKPRRVSAFTEAVLYGALECMTQNPQLNVARLSALRITTQKGPRTASRKRIAQSTHELPMPFTFLHSQLGQALASLTHALSWQGDASILIGNNTSDFIRMSLISSHSHDVLLGWVDEINDDDPQKNHWLWLSPCALPDQATRQHDALDPDTTHIQLNTQGIEYWSASSARSSHLIDFIESQ